MTNRHYKRGQRRRLRRRERRHERWTQIMATDAAEWLAKKKGKRS